MCIAIILIINIIISSSIIIIIIIIIIISSSSSSSAFCLFRRPEAPARKELKWSSLDWEAREKRRWEAPPLSFQKVCLMFWVLPDVCATAILPRPTPDL